MVESQQQTEMSAIQRGLAAHRRFVKQVHTTKFILTGWKLRAVQTFYVTATFCGCLATLRYFTPPQEEIQSKLGRMKQPKTAQIKELEHILADAKARKQQ